MPFDFAPTATLTPTASATITPRRGELQVAPEGINFTVALTDFDSAGPVDGTNTYDAQFHDVYYLWDFDDPGSAFSAPLKIASGHNNANIAYGPNASHTFSAPGTYTVTCLVVETSSGKFATASVDVTVGNADTLFSGEKTIFVSTDGTYARAPVDALTEPTGQAAMATQATLQGSSDDPIRIMFDREVDHVVDNIGFGAGANYGQLRDGYKNVWWCSSPGAGSNALVTIDAATDKGFIEDQTSLGSSGKRTDFTFHDLRIAGYYDSTDETMGGSYPTTNPFGVILVNVRSANFGTYHFFHNLECDGLSGVFSSTATHGQVDQATTNLIANNVGCVNFANFCFFEANQGFSAYTGCRFARDVESVSGNTIGTGGTKIHGGIRIQSGRNCVVDACDFHGKAGWFQTKYGIHTQQTDLRWNQEGVPEARLNCQRSSFEGGGSAPIGLSRQDSAKTVCIQNALIEKCVVVGSAFSGACILAEYPGTTIRNNLLIQAGDRDGVPFSEGLGAFVICSTGTNGSTADYLASPIRIYANTLINQLADAEDLDGNASIAAFRLDDDGGSDFSNVTEANNVLIQPNLDTPTASHTNLSTATLWTPRTADYRDWSHPSYFTLDSDVANDATVAYTYAQLGQVRAFFDETPTNDAHQHEVYIGSGQDMETGTLFAFDGTGVTITNKSGGTWSSGSDIAVVLTTAAINIRTSYALASDTVRAAAPLAGSTAIGDASSGDRVLDDFYGVIPNTGPYAVRTTAGAFEVA